VSDSPVASIRPFSGHREYLACVVLQRTVWGEGFTEGVAPALLWVAQRTGGIASGAFSAAGELLGFVFGITGYRAGEPVHWSDMLAVRPDQRGRGIGRALKMHQRELLLAAGVARAQWTFEPLESRNAWLNFSLGVTVREYIRDAYGEGASELHRGLGTDRLVADWQLGDPRVAARMAGSQLGSEARSAPAVNDVVFDADGWPEPAAPRLDHTEAQLRIRIPADIQLLKTAAAPLARAWRAAARAAFEHYLTRGWVASALLREDSRISSYLLVRS